MTKPTKGLGSLSLDQARAFCTVVDAGGYSKAAEKLHKSHSALVYLIKTLEAQCGFEVFDRSAYRNALTANGRRVYEKCHELLGKADEMEILCHQLQGHWEASLKIVFDGILPFEPFLKIYKAFRREKVPTVVQTYAEYLEGVESAYKSLQADIMISILPSRLRDLETIHLRPIKSYLVAHRDHPLHQTTRRWSVNDLRAFDFLTIRDSGPRLGLNTAEFEESASFFLSDFSFKKEALLKKSGFGWLPEHMIQTELRNKTLLPVKWERKSVHEIQPVLAMSKQIAGGRASQRVIEILQAH